MTATFALTATMKIDDCEKLHQFLTGASGQPVEIDCAEVARLGGLAAQLILMGQKHWAAAGHAFVLSNVTDALTTCVSDLGLPEILPTGEPA